MQTGLNIFAQYMEKSILAWHPSYRHPLPDDHKFPMIKYDLIPEQLMYEGCITADALFAPGPAPAETIALTHDAHYMKQVMACGLGAIEMRRIGFPYPMTSELVLRECIIMQGTIDCALRALETGFAMNIAGGTHHAFAAKGEGFCIFNDFAIAANYLLKYKKTERILICDLDVHQGNGTASIFRNDPRVYTFSMHSKDNYPLRKEISDTDIELPGGCNDETYLALLTENLESVVRSFRPDILFYLCGVDVLGTDKFGKLNLTREGCRKRDEQVFKTARHNALPVVCAAGGGYSFHVKDVVEAHCNTLRTAFTVFF